MKLIELLVVIDSAILVEISSEKEKPVSRPDLPIVLKERLVKSIKPVNNSLLIELFPPPKPKNLEELGYSFETGV